MWSNEKPIVEEIRIMEFDASSAIKWAREGKIEAWVHKYLLAGRWANPGFSEGLKRAKRWWVEPIEVHLKDLRPAVGPEPEMEFVVVKEEWYARISTMAQSFSHPLTLPPLIVEYRAGELSVRDGNTRYGAMKLLGWLKCWVIICYNTESDYHQHKTLI